MSEDISTTVELLTRHVGRVVNRLQEGQLANSSRARPTSAASAALAALRHSDPADPAASPRAWAVTMPDCPEGLLKDRTRASAAELALHAAVCLYAVHQQSRTTAMHRPGISVGAAVRDLVVRRGEEVSADNGAVRRLHVISSATTHPQRVAHLRQLATLLRAEDVPLDYARLAVDLLRLQSPITADGVHLRWARDLHRMPFADDAARDANDSTIST